MKNLLILLAVSIFTFGSAVAATVPALNETVIAEPCGDDGKCKKGKNCCKAKASANTEEGASEIKVDAPAKPAENAAGCSKSAAKPSCCAKKSASASTETENEQKPVAPEKQ